MQNSFKKLIGIGLARVIIISLFATLACVGIIKAATTIGNNITTGGTITSNGANTLYGATSIGGTLTATSTLTVSGLTTLGNASTTLLSVSNSSWLAATTLSGILNMSNYAVQNIGAAGTDFTGTGGLTLADTLTVGGSDERANGTNSYMDFNDGGSGTIVFGGLGNINNENIEFDFETTANNITVTSNSGVTDFKLSGLNLNVTGAQIKGTTQYLGVRSMVAATTAIISLHTALGWITPATNEADLIGNNALTYKNITPSEVDAKGEIWKINGTGASGALNEYICTGTNGTCADDEDYTFIDSAGNGFAAWGWFEVTDTDGLQYLFAKFGATGSKEYRAYLGSDEKLTIGLYDNTYSIGCGQSTLSGLSAGWHQIGFVYDGTGGADANDHIIIYVDGIAVALAANATCTEYVSMANTGAPVEIGSFNGGQIPWQGDIGPVFFKSLPGTDDITTAQMLQIYQTQKVFLGL